MALRKVCVRDSGALVVRRFAYAKSVAYAIPAVLEKSSRLRKSCTQITYANRIRKSRTQIAYANRVRKSHKKIAYANRVRNSHLSSLYMDRTTSWIILIHIPIAVVTSGMHYIEI